MQLDSTYLFNTQELRKRYGTELAFGSLVDDRYSTGAEIIESGAVCKRTSIEALDNGTIVLEFSDEHGSHFALTLEEFSLSMTLDKEMTR